MSEMPRAICRDCQAPIVWTITANQKRMPINVWPAPNGNVILLDPIDSPRAPRSRVLSNEQKTSNTATTYLPHFTTCAKRKKGAKK